MVSSPKYFQAMLENTYTAILLLDDELCLQYMNTAAENLLEVSAMRYDGIPIDNIFTENRKTVEGLTKAKKNKQRFTKRQASLRVHTPADIMVDYTVTPLNEPNGWFLMELYPVDRILKISQEEMMRSSQAVSRKLVRGLAHEIKNPLGGIRGSAQLLERELPDEALKEYTNIIINEADRLRQLVDQMLGPNKKLNMESTNIHEVLEHVRKLLQAEKPSIKILSDYDPSLPDITADKQQMIQAILNVVRNAMQALANQDDSRIILRTRIQRKFTIGSVMHRLIYRIDIIDNGPGIPEDIRENLFFPMVSGREGGTGLGLSIAHSIINQHNGLIKFESEPGETKFSLYLPLEQENDKQ